MPAQSHTDLQYYWWRRSRSLVPCFRCLCYRCSRVSIGGPAESLNVSWQFVGISDAKDFDSDWLQQRELIQANDRLPNRCAYYYCSNCFRLASGDVELMSKRVHCRVGLWQQRWKWTESNKGHRTFVEFSVKQSSSHKENSLRRLITI